MNLPDNLLSEAWYWAAWAAWLPCFALSVWRAPWRRLRESEQMNVWLGMIVCLVLLWSMQAGVRPGLSMHLLGATVFVLCFGPRLAFVGLNLVLLGITLNGAAGFLAFAFNALLMGGASVVLAYLGQRSCQRFLPPNFFIYIYIQAFFGAMLVVLGVGCISSLFLATAEAYSLEYLFSDYFPYFLLLGFAEAWISGMVMTLFVVYRPDWVGSFDDSRYLTGK